MYDNKCINLVNAGNFYFPFSYSASLFVFVFFYTSKKRKEYYIVKNIDKRYPKSYTIY